MKNFMYLLITCAIVLSTNDVKAQQPENVVTFVIGSFEVSVLSEGQQTRKCDNLLGTTPEMLQKYAPEDTYPIATNAFLVRTPEQNILIDAGLGKNLSDNLKTLKVLPGEINFILLTHMHGDHIGGLLADDKVTFPNAQVYLAQAEYNYWMSDDAMQKAPGNRRNGFLQARAVIKAYKDKLHLFVPAELESATVDLIPGIRGIISYGHTPGHTAYMLESDNSRLLVWGDLAHAMTIQMPHPEVAFAADSNPTLAIATRKKILDYAAKSKIPVAGMHIVFPAIGDVRISKDEGYTFEPFCLCLGF